MEGRMTLLDPNSSIKSEGSLAQGFLLSCSASGIVAAGVLLVGVPLADSNSGPVHVIGVLLNWFVLTIAVTQFAYILPLLRYFTRSSAPDTAKGVAIGAALTAFINGVYWLFFIRQFQ
jgi:hypothetical protein